MALPWRRRKRRAVLVVDDDPATLALIRHSAENAGFKVLAATSAEEAMEILHRGEKFNAILTDVMLPGTTGWTLRRKILDQWPEANIIVMSGAQESFGYMPRGDVIACMVKPTTFTQFFNDLQEKT